MKVKELLTSADYWTKGVNARDKHGNSVLTSSDEACRWCLHGALMRCYFTEPTGKEYWAIRELILQKLAKRNINSVVAFNDSATFDQVQQLVEELDI